MFERIQDSTMVLTRLAPEACPNAAGKSRFFAHRRFPSMMMPTCLGRGFEDNRIRLQNEGVILQPHHSLKRPQLATLRGILIGLIKQLKTYHGLDHQSI